MNHHGQRLFGSGRPFDDLFSPQHSKAIVDPAFRYELLLRGIPQLVMCGSGLELVGRVEETSDVSGMSGQRIPSPLRKGGILIIVCRECAHIESEFTPRDQLVEKSLALRSARNRYLLIHLMHSYVPEVEIRRKSTGRRATLNERS